MAGFFSCAAASIKLRSCALTEGLVIFLISSQLLDATSPRHKPDTLCNIGDEHECVCDRSRGDMDKISIPCDRFIEAKKIPSLCMMIKMKFVDLGSRLYTNETYQHYLRRRLAQLVSNYCDQVPWECGSGTQSMVRYEARENLILSNKKVGKPISPSFLLEPDEEEPSFTSENIVLLRVMFFERNRTEVCLVVTKSNSAGSLNELVTLDPQRVKLILNSQLAPLSRILGGIRIEGLRVADVKKRKLPGDNTLLISLMCAIGVAMLVCYTIAITKIIIDRREKWAQKRRTSSKPSRRVKTTRSYGTCTEKFMLSNYESAANGKPKSSKSKSITSIISGLSTRKKKSATNEDELHDLSADNSGRSQQLDRAATNYQNIFTCDPSQLPEEEKSNYWRSFDSAGNVDNGAHPPATQSHFQSNGPMEDNGSTRPSLPGISPPNLVLVTSYKSSPGMADESDEWQPGIAMENATMDVHGKVSAADVSTLRTELLGVRPDYERPLSRRGSRESTPEQGGEECPEDRESTPVPLGDRDTSLPGSRCSSSGSEASRGYHPLAEDDSSDGAEQFSASGMANDPTPTADLLEDHIDIARRPQKETTKSTEESETEESDETRMLTRHYYEKLQESPSNESTTAEELADRAFHQDFPR